MMNTTEIPVALVDSSNALRNLGRPLTKIPTPLPTLPSISRVPGKVGAYGDVTRVHRSVALSDSGEGFAMDRLSSEVYPIPGPLCDMRGTFQIFGCPSRYDGRNEHIYEA